MSDLLDSKKEEPEESKEQHEDLDGSMGNMSIDLSTSEQQQELELLLCIHKYRTMPFEELEQLSTGAKDLIYMWTDLFYKHFLQQNEEHTEDDDMLFFVTKNDKDLQSAYDAVFVLRRDSPNLPGPDNDYVNWEETVCLNTIMHKFHFKIALAVSENNNSEGSKLKIINKVTNRVYPSTERHKMDGKAKKTYMTYPLLYFNVDDFEEIYSTILLDQNQSLCLQLAATDTITSRKTIIFQGKVSYESMLSRFNRRRGLLTAALGRQREFMKLQGPRGKGQAQIAVSVPEMASISKLN